MNEVETEVKASNAENLNRRIEEIFRLMNNYEQTIVDIQLEASNFRQESQVLKENLAAIIAENNQLKSQKNQPDNIATFRNDYIIVADKIFTNLRNQLYLVNQEKEMYENLWKKTAHVLEREVPINSISKIKAEHSSEILKLKEELSILKSSSEKGFKINQILQTKIKLMSDEAIKLHSSNKQISEKLKKAETENKELQDQIQEFEKCFAESNELNREQMHKSAETFKKLQESVQVADEAMSEIDILMKEKRQMEEECNWLSSTIGSVIEKESTRIDKDVEELKTNHEHEVETFRQTVELEREKSKSALQQVKLLEEKLKGIDKANSFLGQDLQTAIKTIVETEEKFLKMKETMENESSSKKLKQEIKKLQKIVENNKKNKEQWKSLIMDVTVKLEKKIETLLRENYELKRSKQRS